MGGPAECRPGRSCFRRTVAAREKPTSVGCPSAIPSAVRGRCERWFEFGDEAFGGDERSTMFISDSRVCSSIIEAILMALPSVVESKLKAIAHTTFGASASIGGTEDTRPLGRRSGLDLHAFLAPGNTPELTSPIRRVVNYRKARRKLFEKTVVPFRTSASMPALDQSEPDLRLSSGRSVRVGLIAAAHPQVLVIAWNRRIDSTF
jgi:hypothetical protein